MREEKIERVENKLLWLSFITSEILKKSFIVNVTIISATICTYSRENLFQQSPFEDFKPLKRSFFINTCIKQILYHK